MDTEYSGQKTPETQELQVAPRPFVKWAGGKRQLLPELMVRLPDDIEQRLYIEPFVGGGALFFALEPNGAVLGDLCMPLIGAYTEVQHCPQAVAEHLRDYGDRDSKGSYRRIRKAFNVHRGMDVGRLREMEPGMLGAQFIYLNHAGYNGLWRVNSDGEMNVPYGSREALSLPTQRLLNACSRTLRDVALFHLDFHETLERIKVGGRCFVFLDPPYHGVSRTANFTGFTQKGFSEDDHKQLCMDAISLDRMGVPWMMTSSDTPFIEELYKEFRIEIVPARRSINCNGAKRKGVHELIIRNY